MGNLKDIWAPPLGRIPCSLGGPRFHCSLFQNTHWSFPANPPPRSLRISWFRTTAAGTSFQYLCLSPASLRRLSQPLLGCIFLSVPEVMMWSAADQTGVTCPWDMVAREDTQVRKLRSPICSLCSGYRVYFEGKGGHGCLSRARSPL